MLALLLLARTGAAAASSSSLPSSWSTVSSVPHAAMTSARYTSGGRPSTASSSTMWSRCPKSLALVCALGIASLLAAAAHMFYVRRRNARQPWHAAAATGTRATSHRPGASGSWTSWGRSSTDGTLGSTAKYHALEFDFDAVAFRAPKNDGRHGGLASFVARADARMDDAGTGHRRPNEKSGDGV